MQGISIQTLGCKVNQVESEQIAEELSGRFAVESGRAVAVVLNTCAVTGEAEAKTRKAIRRAAAEPSVLAVVVTGCAATTSGDALAALDSKVLVVTDKTRVADAVERFLAERGIEIADDTPVPVHHRTRRAVKVQDGCENFCTYCIVPYARGAGRSTEVTSVVQQVGDLVSEGVGEVVLTGINIGKYRDDSADADLAALVRALAQTGLHRVRLSSIEPPDVTDELLAALSDRSFGCEHLHVPLQSGSDRTLAAMGRRYTVAEFEQAVDRIRSIWPKAAITTDIIVGFPTETDEDFEETVQVCRRVGFSKIHVFRYSPRDGTPAASLDAVDPKLVAERAERLRILSDELARSFARTFDGGDVEVVVERVVGGMAHVTSREYMQFSVPISDLGGASVPLAEGALLSVPCSLLLRSSLGLE